MIQKKVDEGLTRGAPVKPSHPHLESVPLNSARLSESAPKARKRLAVAIVTTFEFEQTADGQRDKTLFVLHKPFSVLE